MTYTVQSSRPTAELEVRLREAAARHKFGILNVHDLQQILKSKGIDFDRECRIFDVCNPQAASQALKAGMEASAVLPCRISIFSEGDGCTIATVKPTDLLRAAGLSGMDQLAAEIEKEVLAMMEEAA